MLFLVLGYFDTRLGFRAEELRNLSKSNPIMEEILDSLEEIKETTGNKNIDLMLCDFSSLKSINDFVKKLKKQYDKIDVLLNHHGSVFLKKTIAKD